MVEPCHQVTTKSQIGHGINLWVIYPLLLFIAHKAVAEICLTCASRFSLFRSLVLETLGPPPPHLSRDRGRSYHCCCFDQCTTVSIMCPNIIHLVILRVQGWLSTLPYINSTPPSLWKESLKRVTFYFWIRPHQYKHIHFSTQLFPFLKENGTWYFQREDLKTCRETGDSHGGKRLVWILGFGV